MLRAPGLPGKTQAGAKAFIAGNARKSIICLGSHPEITQMHQINLCNLWILTVRLDCLHHVGCLHIKMRRVPDSLPVAQNNHLRSFVPDTREVRELA